MKEDFTGIEKDLYIAIDELYDFGCMMKNSNAPKQRRVIELLKAMDLNAHADFFYKKTEIADTNTRKIAPLEYLIFAAVGCCNFKFEGDISDNLRPEPLEYLLDNLELDPAKLLDIAPTLSSAAAKLNSSSLDFNKVCDDYKKRYGAEGERSLDNIKSLLNKLNLNVQTYVLNTKYAASKKIDSEAAASSSNTATASSIPASSAVASEHTTVTPFQWTEENFPSWIVEAFGGFHNIMKLPVLDLKGRMGWTNYIDFLQTKDTEGHMVMRGEDIFGRPFFALSMLCITTNEFRVCALFQRDQKEKNSWTWGGNSFNSYDCPFNAPLNEEDGERISKLIKSEKIEHANWYIKKYEFQLAISPLVASISDAHSQASSTAPASTEPAAGPATAPAESGTAPAVTTSIEPVFRTPAIVFINARTTKIEQIKEAVVTGTDDACDVAGHDLRKRKNIIGFK